MFPFKISLCMSEFGIGSFPREENSTCNGAFAFTVFSSIILQPLSCCSLALSSESVVSYVHMLVLAWCWGSVSWYTMKGGVRAVLISQTCHFRMQNGMFGELVVNIWFSTIYKRWFGGLDLSLDLLLLTHFFLEFVSY